MSKELSAKKYFISGFKDLVSNEHKSLAKLSVPSIRELLMEYIEIHEEITMNLELDKLNNARKEHIQAMNFYIKRNILVENVLYHKEFNLLVDKLNQLLNVSDKQKELLSSQVYILCNSLIKKFEYNNIYVQIIESVKNSNSFSQIESALHFFVNELIYDGYSLRYLENWYKKNIRFTSIDTSNVNGILDIFGGLKKKDEKFEFYINIVKNEFTDKQTIYIDFNLILNRVDFQILELKDANTGKEAKTFLQQSNEYILYKVETIAKDYYKALDKVLNSISSYFQMIDYVSKENTDFYLEKIICVFCDGNLEKIRINKKNELNIDSEILFGNIEKREKQDVEDFISYRQKVFTENIVSMEVFNIQRALNIVKHQALQSSENKIINLWAVLEYMLTFKESNGSIISKVKSVIPKVVSLYFMKDKLNIFWSRIYEYKDKSITIIDEFMQCKKNNDAYQYDIEKLIHFIKEKGKRLISELEFNPILAREVGEIGLYLNSPKELADIISNNYNNIELDLVRIYRSRNILIHSGKESKSDLNIRSLRLYRYNNNLIGLIIYYMCQNPEFKISEILNSIDYTYDHYITRLKSNTVESVEIFKPKYLFIG